MPIQRRIQCAAFYGFRGGKKRLVWFTINEYQSYKHAFKIAKEQAAEYADGELIVFDDRTVSIPLIKAISTAEDSSDRMTELVYLQNVHHLLKELEKQAEGFINDFDRILETMIDETQLRIDSARFKE